VGACLFRIFEWNPDERAIILSNAPALVLDWNDSNRSLAGSDQLHKISDAILTARTGLLRAWQAGSYPGRLELLATMVASFLPFARYQDTKRL